MNFFTTTEIFSFTSLLAKVGVKPLSGHHKTDTGSSVQQQKTQKKNCLFFSKVCFPRDSAEIQLTFSCSPVPELCRLTELDFGSFLLTKGVFSNCHVVKILQVLCKSNTTRNNANRPQKFIIRRRWLESSHDELS